MAALKWTVVALALALVTVSVQAACPDFKAGQGCLTGSCKNGGLAGDFSIPSISKMKCTKSKCTYEKELEEDEECAATEKIKAVAKKTPEKCCKQCKKEKGLNCKFWQWVPLAGTNKGICFMYSTTGPSCDPHACPSKVGSKCQDPEVVDDPHLVGAHGAHYDFSGQPDKSFCLLTDHNLHINMKMTGYLDKRTESATVLENGKAVRTWIRELGILWSVEGSEHKLRLMAREGKDTIRGEGFLAMAEMDSTILPRLQVGDELALEGGLTFKFEAIERRGSNDVDFYTIRIGDLLDIDIRLRVAHPLLQRPEDAETHISLGINQVKNSNAIHGVLGQTYRQGREERAAKFNNLVALLQRNVGADSEEGKGFLDGMPADYVSSNVLAADCHYSAFNGHVLPTTISSE